MTTNRLLTILLIEDNPDFAKLVQRWLIPNEAEPEFIVVWKNSLLAGVQRLEQGGVDLILLDLGLPDSNGPETFSRIKAHSQAAPIIVLSAGDESLALQMVEQGAQDYLVKSTCRSEVLAKAIRFALIRQATKSATPGAAELAKTVGVIGAKGGVGTTTFACNLAAELRALTNQKTLLMDLDVNAGLVGFLANVHSKLSLLDAIANIDRLDLSCWSGIVSRGLGDLDILPAPCLLGRTELNPSQVREILAAVRSYYRWFVLDFGRLSSFSMALLSQADELYLLTTTQVPALYEAKRTVDGLRDMGFAMDRLRLVVRQIGDSPNIQRSDMDNLFGIAVDLRLSDAKQELQQAYSAGKLPDKAGAFRRQVAGFARKIANLPQEAPKHRLPRLFAKQAIR